MGSKRFFCTLCGRVRRSTHYPADVMMVESDQSRTGVTPLEANVPRRAGTCWRHGSGRPMQRTMRHVRAVVQRPAMASAPKQKRGKR